MRENRLAKLPDALEPLRHEIEVYYRALPRLLYEGEEGRYVVVHGDYLSEPWDTFRDAMQHGRSRASAGQFLAQKIDLRHLPALADLFETKPTLEAAS